MPSRTDRTGEDDYDCIIATVADHPGAEPADVHEHVDDLDRDRVDELLAMAVTDADLVEADGKYWVMRSGEYAFEP